MDETDRLQLSSGAQWDLTETWQHIAADNPDNADRFISRVLHGAREREEICKGFRG